MGQQGMIERIEHLIDFGQSIIFVTADSGSTLGRLSSQLLSIQPESSEVLVLKSQADDSANRTSLLRQFTGQVSQQSTTLAQHCQHYFGQQQTPNLCFVLQAEKLSSQFVLELSETFQLALHDKQPHQLVVFTLNSDLIRLKTLCQQSGVEAVVIECNDTVSTAQQSELDALIAGNRERLSDRIKHRESVAEISQPNQKRFGPLRIFSVIGLFLLVFCGLLAMLYQEQDPHDTIAENKPVTTDVANTVETGVSQNPNKAETIVTETSPPVTKKQEQRVLAWSDAVTQLSIDDEVTSHTDSSVQSQMKNTNSPVLAEPKLESTQELLSKRAEDTVIKLPLQTQAILEQGNRADDPPQSTKVQSKLAETVTTALPYQLPEIPNNGYVVQLAAMSNKNVVAEFVSSNALFDKVWQYTATRMGETWYVLLSNKIFKSSEQARQHVQSIDRKIFSSRPFVRSVSSVINEAQN